MFNEKYIPPYLVGNGHVDTLLPHFFRKREKCDYFRERIKTSDADFLDLDWSKEDLKKIVVLSHGLESSSSAQYILGMVKHLNSAGFDCLAWNYRGCSGETNLRPQYYHSGATHDLNDVINHVITNYNYEEIYLVGFSLGGNLTLKYIGEQGENLHPLIKKACAFSAPCDLKSASIALEKGFSKVYTDNFLKTLLQKVDAKSEILKESGFDLESVKRVKSLNDFDNLITGPLHGFKDAEDYYAQCSSKQFLHQIKIPTLFVNALNDPFLGPGCFPYVECEKNELITFLSPKRGGHCGFMRASFKNLYWSEKKTLEFFNA